MDARRLDELASAYRPAQILFTALRLGVFNALAAGPRSHPDLARGLGTDERGTRILCDALAALELLEKDADGRFRNAPVAQEVLLSGGAESKRAMYLHGARQMARWAGLYDVVRLGRPTPEEEIDHRLSSDARAFAAAMRDVGRQSAAKLAEVMDFAGVRRLLDVGGGPGTYALELAGRYPDLEAVVFDRPDTAEVARENVREAGLEDRVQAVGGDALEDDLGGPYDFILVSNLVHVFPEEANRRLVHNCAAALAGGGRLAIKDFLLDPDRTSPTGAALFAVNMLVSTEAGDGYTVQQVSGWMRDAGLEPQPAVDLTAQSRVLVGRR